MLSVGYVKEEPVLAGDREISAEPVFGTRQRVRQRDLAERPLRLCPACFDRGGACTGGQTT